ncbi:MAG: FOG: GGDEF domain [uncultured Paraburkholderia sp.]|nr:MAG: FOG: GGDEF domain [uncultured Paraburkholderia sp.]
MVTRRPNLIIAISVVLASAILAIAVWVLAQSRDLRSVDTNRDRRPEAAGRAAARSRAASDGAV